MNHTNVGGIASQQQLQTQQQPQQHQATTHTYCDVAYQINNNTNQAAPPTHFQQQQTLTQIKLNASQSQQVAAASAATTNHFNHQNATNSFELHNFYNQQRQKGSEQQVSDVKQAMFEQGSMQQDMSLYDYGNLVYIANQATDSTQQAGLYNSTQTPYAINSFEHLRTTQRIQLVAPSSSAEQHMTQMVESPSEGVAFSAVNVAQQQQQQYMQNFAKTKQTPRQIEYQEYGQKNSLNNLVPNQLLSNMQTNNTYNSHYNGLLSQQQNHQAQQFLQNSAIHSQALLHQDLQAKQDQYAVFDQQVNNSNQVYYVQQADMNGGNNQQHMRPMQQHVPQDQQAVGMTIAYDEHVYAAQHGPTDISVSQQQQQPNQNDQKQREAEDFDFKNESKANNSNYSVPPESAMKQERTATFISSPLNGYTNSAKMSFTNNYAQQQYISRFVHPQQQQQEASTSQRRANENYIDISTNGGLSQEWLDMISRLLIEHMNKYGICVIDNFLGSIKGNSILKEVLRLYSSGHHVKGKLVSNKISDCSASTSPSTTPLSSLSSSTQASTSAASAPNQSTNIQSQQPQRTRDNTGAIRSDRVIWVDGCEDGCEEINNLIQTLCSVITNSARLSLYSNNELDRMVINKRTKAHIACYPGNATRYIKHIDNPNGDGRVITAIYYPNKDWDIERDGGLLRMFPAGMDEVANIEPLFDRVLFFWSDRRNPHEVLPSYRERFAITVWYIGETRT